MENLNGKSKDKNFSKEKILNNFDNNENINQKYSQIKN